VSIKLEDSSSFNESDSLLFFFKKKKFSFELIFLFYDYFQV